MSAQLPGVLAEIAEIAGVDVAHKVALAFGGQELWCGPHVQPGSKLARLVGLQTARAIAKALGPGAVMIPKGPARRDRRARALLADGALSHREIAEATGLHVRQVERHARGLRDDRQLALDLCGAVDRRVRRGGR